MVNRLAGEVLKIGVIRSLLLLVVPKNYLPFHLAVLSR
jgi:hypothetical protein